jgi:hypothetical protein
MKQLHKTLARFYLDYVNSSLDYQAIMLDNDLTKNEIDTLLSIGKRIHEDRAKLAKLTNGMRKVNLSLHDNY